MFLGQLSEKVRNTPFNDVKGSAKDPVLLGPASVEFAPYGRVPNSRTRKDQRQGTIDQDPEFIDFLESLTNPIAKPATVDQETDGANKSKEKITTTPLIQYLRDKKANKGKDNTNVAKGVKHSRQDSKDGKPNPVVDKKTSMKTLAAAVPPPDKRSPQAIKVEKAAREVVRVLNKQAVNNNKGTTAPASPATPATTASLASVTPSPLADKKRERGSTSAAARILQRDLGLGVNPEGRGGRRGGPIVPGRVPANSASSTGKQDAGSNISNSKEPTARGVAASNIKAGNAPTSTTMTNNNKAQSTVRTPTGPSAIRAPLKPSPSLSTSNAAAGSGFSPAKATPAPSTATQAFLKHANPSQGITEPLLEESFAGFGAVKKVEIDKKKGFAYVDFAEPQGLQNAIKSSPVKVAQGQVVVLERKTGPTLQARNMRGGNPMMGNRGGGAHVMRGGGVPIGGRGGRGGLVRRGGGPSTPSKGAAPVPNPNVPSTTMITASSSTQGAAVAEPPVISISEKPRDTSSTAGSLNETASAPSDASRTVSTTTSELQGT